MTEAEAIALALKKSSWRFNVVYRQDPKGVEKMIASTRTICWLKARNVNRHMDGNVSNYTSYIPQVQQRLMTEYGKGGKKQIKTGSILSAILVGVVIKLIVEYISTMIKDQYFS